MPAMKNLVLLLVVALSGCGPSIDPAAKADIDRRISLLQPSANAVPAPAPGTFAPMPFVAGQWSQYKMVDDKGEPSFLTYKVLGEEGGATWIESVMETYHGKTISKMLVFFGSRMDPNQLEIRAAKTKDPKGNVNEIPPNMMPMLQSLYRGAVSSLVLNWQGLPQEAATAPAGRFDGCFHARTDAQWGPWRSVADSWSHPGVPISGLVRSKGVDKPFSMELVSFGASGAVSEM